MRTTSKGTTAPPRKPRRESTQPAPPPRRGYNSPVRREQSAATRERIIAAGSELVHGFPAWDWKNLTAGAVGRQAGVSERTVHRYFSTERKLRDAVLQRLLEESGISLQTLELADFAGTTARMIRYLSSFAAAPATVDDPSFASMDRQRRDALLMAVARATPEWPDRDRESVAAVLDMLWNPPTFERLVSSWGFDDERVIGAITWLIGLIEATVRSGRRPGPGA